MKLKFFCKVINKDNDQYSVLVHPNDLSEIPTESNQTVRKIYSNFEYKIDTLLYVIDSDLVESPSGKKLVVNNCYELHPVKAEVTVPTVPFSAIDDMIKKLIMDSSYHPVDILK
jgi:hypothetical protein